MNLSFLQFAQRLRSSYWFLPAVMLVLAICLGAFMIWLDAGPAARLFDGVSWYQRSKPEGARGMLSTIAGSMITVAGTVFSITIVAISFAANQYGPRILTNFMSDRGNQFTLGTFVATFAYAVVVLRTIHAGDSSDFVPQLAIGVALLLALCSIAVLIYFIHHVPESIHVNTVAATIGRHLLDAVEDYFPDPPPSSAPETEELLQGFKRQADRVFEVGRVGQVTSDRDGYIQALDYEGLVSVAHDAGAVIKLNCSPGDFLFKGQPVALVNSGLDDQLCKHIRNRWTVGTKRTADQDPMFLVDELVEIAARALSPGVNDPHTANTCVDWLAAGIAKMGSRAVIPPYRIDSDGKLRLVIAGPSFREYVQRSFGQLRPYVAGDINAAAHALTSLGAVESQCKGESRLVVQQEREQLEKLARARNDEELFAFLPGAASASP